MADIDIAVEYVLRQEDSKLSGVITTDAGGRTRFGVAEKYHKELTNTGFFDKMPTAQALEVAIKIYQNTYADECELQKINNQAEANTLLSYAINTGTVTAIKMLQRVLAVADDGIMGPGTISAMNSYFPAHLMLAWKSAMLQFYDDKVSENPTQRQYLNGWINRVNANSTQEV